MILIRDLIYRKHTRLCCWNGNTTSQMNVWKPSSYGTNNHHQVDQSSDPVIDSGQVRKITFALPPITIYVTGDHVLILPMNSDEVIKRFLTCFELEITSITKSNQLPVFQLVWTYLTTSSPFSSKTIPLKYCPGRPMRRSAVLPRSFWFSQGYSLGITPLLPQTNPIHIW